VEVRSKGPERATLGAARLDTTMAGTRSSSRQLMTPPLPASHWRLPPAAPSGRPRPPGCWAARSGLTPCGRRRVRSTGPPG